MYIIGQGASSDEIHGSPKASTWVESFSPNPMELLITPGKRAKYRRVCVTTPSYQAKERGNTSSRVYPAQREFELAYHSIVKLIQRCGRLAREFRGPYHRKSGFNLHPPMQSITQQLTKGNQQVKKGDVQYMKATIP